MYRIIFHIAFLVSLLFFPDTSKSQDRFQVKTVVLEESKLRILGTSNVTDFECLYKKGFEGDTLNHSASLNRESIAITGDTLQLIIESFDCGKRGINRDLRKTLESKNYPTIDITIRELKISLSSQNKAIINISIAGVSKEYELEFDTINMEQRIFKVHGNQHMKMTDFGIDPPRALLGLIKVRDELIISFDMLIRHL